jgi:uncharacterized protein (TIGR00288 family)
MTSPQSHAHLPRTLHKEPPAHAPNAALMIDFDNVTMGIRSDLQSELRRLLQSDIIKGKVAVQRAYADWRRYPQYVVPLAESSIDMIWAPAYGSNKKNATDIRLAVDALELVFTRPEIGTFILLSGDSDFSSLVLKLKEYGKYVIGVGIRESSSDLLIQNCDEYYSYNELAGLTKEGDVELKSHDPWELVIEAVKQMTAHNDVMRSDRLKQVMQEIDPTFDEKNYGFSRFSKFVSEAASKGLIHLTKMDSGQFEVALGVDVAEPAADRDGQQRESRDRDREKSRESRPPRESRRGLGEAFGLLKQALGRFGGDKPVSADELRDTMVELKGGESAQLEPARFPGLLRKAHDAEIIDLSKEDDGAYAVKLREEAARRTAPLPERRPDVILEPAADAELPQPAAAEAQPPAAAAPQRSARFRRGSRGGPRAGAPEIPKIGVVEVDPNYTPPPRQEYVPARPVAEPIARPAPSAPVVPPEGERGDRGEARDSRGRRRGGRGGRGRRPEGAERERADRPPRSDRGPREERSEAERGRSPRGGRGRASQRGASDETPRGEPRAAPEPKATPAAPKPTAAPEPEGEGFWSRVKRGLTGGA